MKDLIVTINSATRKVKLNKDFIGLCAENLQGNIIVDFEDEFVDGLGFLEVNINGNKFTIGLNQDADNKIYLTPIKSNLLKVACNIICQVRISQEAINGETPVFRSDQFVLPCKESVCAENELPEDPQTWQETIESQIAEIQNQVGNKVSKVDGKELSTNDYDDTEKGNVEANTKARHTHTNKEILDSTTASYTTEEKDKLNNKADKTMLSNPNLLINGDFRINQRGKTSYTVGAKYSVDRWMLWYGSLVVNSDGSVTHTANDNWQGLRYYIEFPSRLAGKTLTLSTYGSSSNTRTFDVVLFKAGTSSSSVLASSGQIPSGESINSITFTVPNDVTDNDKLSIVLYTPYKGNSVTWYYAKLELGSVATANSPRPYAEELAMCKRYYQKYQSKGNFNIFANGVLRNSTNGRFFMPITNSLRVLPTIETKDLRILNFATYAEVYNNLTVSILSLTDGLAIIQVTSTETIGSDGYTLQLFGSSADGYIALDSEIY